MKLYTAFAPNPLRVTIFLNEKGIDIPSVVMMDVMKGDARTDEHLKRNSLGELPVLELEDGTYLSESLAICRYLEAQFPATPLMGSNAKESAIIEMWDRRIERQIMDTIGAVGLHTFPFFADKIEQLPQYAESQQRALPKKWAWLDAQMTDGRAFIAGDQFSVADITGMAALIICDFAKLPVPDEFDNVKRWEAAMRSRGSWPKLN